MDALERGDMIFSDAARVDPADYSGDGPVELLVDDSVKDIYDLCSPVQKYPSLPTRPWTGECLHGFGHGAFMFAVESLAAAHKPISVIEVLATALSNMPSTYFFFSSFESTSLCLSPFPPFCFQVLRRGEAVCVAISGGWAPAVRTLAEKGTEILSCFTGLWMVATDISSAIGVFEADPKRYAWPESGLAEWNRLFESTRQEFPALCIDRKEMHKIPRRPFSRSHAQKSKGVIALAESSTSYVYLDEKDLLAGACIFQASTYDLPSVDSKLCFAMARESLISKMQSTSLAAVSCAASTGADFLKNSNTMAEAHSFCNRFYNNKASKLSMPGRALYLGCVSGASNGLATWMRSGYGSNENSELDTWRGDPKYFLVKDTWEIHTKQLLGSRVPGEKLLVVMCLHLAEKDPAAFGACVTGAMTTLNREGGLYFGRCLLNMATETERSRRRYFELLGASNAQSSNITAELDK